MTDRELMQQALDALTTYDGTNGESKRKRVLAALRERLAQPEQGPSQWQGLTDDEIENFFQGAADADDETHIRFARAIENLLRSRNT